MCRGFTDGTSYTAPATITDPSTDPDIATESFSFNDPPAIDITTAPLPSPAVTLTATSPHSLLLAGNLAPVLGKLTARFGSQDLIRADGDLPRRGRSGHRGEQWRGAGDQRDLHRGADSAIPDRLRRPPQRHRLLPTRPGSNPAAHRAITTKGKARLGSISRFVLTNSLPGGNSGWTIYLTSGSTRFQALVLGNDPQIITPGGAHDLN